MESESELVRRCRAGDSLAWNEMFDRYYAAAGRFVFQLDPAFSKEDVEEICQETFLSVIKNLASFQGHSQFQTWLFRIATNKARDYRERQCAAKRGGGQIPISLNAENNDGLTMEIPVGTAGPDDSLMNAERMLGMRQALDELGNPCREIIELRYFGDLSYQEIALMLSLNQKTVSSRLSKCLDRLEQIVKTRFAREKSTPFSV